MMLAMVCLLDVMLRYARRLMPIDDVYRRARDTRCLFAYAIIILRHYYFPPIIYVTILLFTFIITITVFTTAAAHIIVADDYHARFALCRARAEFTPLILCASYDDASTRGAFMRCRCHAIFTLCDAYER